MLALAESWIPYPLPDPPASRIVVASSFIGEDGAWGRFLCFLESHVVCVYIYVLIDLYRMDDLTWLFMSFWLKNTDLSCVCVFFYHFFLSFSYVSVFLWI